jgi:hypothetical protein
LTALRITNKKALTMKKLLVILLPVLVLSTTVLYAFASRPSLPPQEDSGATLSDEQLLAFALQVAHEYGLRGQPTEQTILKFPANQWSATMLGMGIEGKTVFFLSVKGEIEPGHMIGGGAYLEEDVVPQAPEGLSIALDAADGRLWVVTSRYIADPLSETTDEHRQLYQLRQDPEYNQRIYDLMPPAPQHPILGPPESTREITPQDVLPLP